MKIKAWLGTYTEILDIEQDMCLEIEEWEEWTESYKYEYVEEFMRHRVDSGFEVVSS